MKVSEVMHEGLIKGQVTDSIRDIAKLMKENDIGSLPLFEDDTAVGFVTDRDIVLALADDDANLEDAINLAMSRVVYAIDSEEDIFEAAKLMEEEQISRLLVTDKGTPVGIVSLKDLSTNLDLENTDLKAEVISEIKN